MIDGTRVVAIIPARAGSKGVPRKNLRPIAGVPLVAWPIEVAKMCPEIDRIIVSTDGEEIASVARQYGAEVMMRPEHLASDTAMVADLLRHMIKEMRRDGETATIMLVLEPTSPFRTPDDVTACLELMKRDHYDSVATFVEAELNPHRAWRIENGKPTIYIDGAVPWLPRQKLPPAYQLTGAVYAFDMDKLGPSDPSILVGKCGAVLMDRRRALDINDTLDFMVGDALVASGECPDLTALRNSRARARVEKNA
jgi:CMP-N,N'-diacetyllegionaminic acid synthase